MIQPTCTAARLDSDRNCHFGVWLPTMAPPQTATLECGCPRWRCQHLDPQHVAANTSGYKATPHVLNPPAALSTEDT